MTRFVCSIGAVLLLFVTACGGSEEATPGGYSDTCPDGKCEEGLDCVINLCTSECVTNADCARHSGTSICASNSRCYEPCNDTTVCKRLHPDLVCNQVAAQQGTCRAP